MIYGEGGDDILHAVNKKGANVLDGGDGFDICVPQNNKTTVSTLECEITS